jgi:hypothetical protein
MEIHETRKLLFKAWNKETRLLMRLQSIDCKKGELFKKDHILLQFTGLLDKNGEEIYDMDVLMIGSEKFFVTWNHERNGWNLTKLKNRSATEPLLKKRIEAATRLWSYYESPSES